MVESLTVCLQRRERLVRLGEDVGDRVELVAVLAGEDRHGLSLLRDRDHERLRLPRHTFGRPVPGAGLVRRDRRIRHQLNIGLSNLGDCGVDDDRAVHLRQLVEQLRGEGLVEPNSAGEHERQLRGLPDHDQGAFPGTDDVVDPLSQRRPGRDA